MTTENTIRLGKLALGLSLGTVWALGVFLMGLLATYCDFGSGFVSAVGTLYFGYKATILGSVIGAIWGFIDMFVLGVLVAYFYNFFLCCSCPFHKKNKEVD